MKPKRIHSLIDSETNLSKEFTCLAAKTQPLYDFEKIYAGCKGKVTAIKRLLAKCCEELHLDLSFLDEDAQKQKIYEHSDEKAVLYFQNFYPPEEQNSQEHIHWSNFRHDDWVRQKINYTYINSGNLGSEAYSPLLEIAEILRLNSALTDTQNKTVTILFVPDKPASPAPVHSAIFASLLQKMNVNLMCPESHPLDFEALSKAETFTFANKQNFNLYLTPDKEVLQASDLIYKASWAKLGKDYDFNVQMNQLAELRKTWNELLIPENKEVFEVFSYPNFKKSELNMIEQAMKLLLQYLIAPES